MKTNAERAATVEFLIRDKTSPDERVEVIAEALDEACESRTNEISFNEALAEAVEEACNSRDHEIASLSREVERLREALHPSDWVSLLPACSPESGTSSVASTLRLSEPPSRVLARGWHKLCRIYAETLDEATGQRIKRRYALIGEMFRRGIAVQEDSTIYGQPDPEDLSPKMLNWLRIAEQKGVLRGLDLADQIFRPRPPQPPEQAKPVEEKEGYWPLEPLPEEE